MTSINIDDFPIEIDPEIDDDFLSVIDYYRFLSIVIITDKLFFVTSISIDFRYQSILVGELNNRLISIDFRYRLTTSGMSVKCIQSRKC